MTASVETTGKTIEQALEKALRELGASKDDVDIKLLAESPSGLRGIFGGKVVRIRVTRREPSWGKRAICTITSTAEATWARATCTGRFTSGP